MRIGQTRRLPAGYYTLDVWVRSTGKMPVYVSLNILGQEDAIKVLVTPSWRKVHLEQWVGPWGVANFTLAAYRPGVLWIDDAELRRTSDGVATWITLAILIAIVSPFAAAGIRRVQDAASEGSVTVAIHGQYGIDSGDGPDKGKK
jgi:hypothetical protein